MSFLGLKQNLAQYSYWKRLSFYKAIGEREEGRERMKEEEEDDDEEDEEEEEEEKCGLQVLQN